MNAALSEGNDLGVPETEQSLGLSQGLGETLPEF